MKELSLRDPSHSTLFTSRRRVVTRGALRLPSQWITNTIRRLSRGHPVGEIFLIGWAFAYCIEGAAGFGTPVALASPTLAALGHDPVMVVCCLLAMNTLGTPFGAAGTPIWFGFDGLALSEDELLRVSVITAALTGVSALIIPVLAASFLVPFTALRRCWIFVLVSIVSVAGPSVAVAIWSYEFPTLFGGICGMVVTSLLLHFHVGLYPVDDLMPPRDRPRDRPSPSDTDAPTTSTASKADDASEDDTVDAASKATTTHNGSPNPSQPRENLINGKPASKAAVAAMRTFPLWVGRHTIVGDPEDGDPEDGDPEGVDSEGGDTRWSSTFPLGARVALCI